MVLLYMMLKLLHEITIKMDDLAAERAFEMKMLMAIRTIQPCKLKAGTLPVTSRKTEHDSFGCQSLKVPVDSGSVGFISILSQKGKNISNCDSRSFILAQADDDRLPLGSLISITSHQISSSRTISSGRNRTSLQFLPRICSSSLLRCPAATAISVLE